MEKKTCFYCVGWCTNSSSGLFGICNSSGKKGSVCYDEHIKFVENNLNEWFNDILIFTYLYFLFFN